MAAAANCAAPLAWVREALDNGAELLAGSRREGTWPTALTDVPADAQVMTDEVFGPVLTIEPFDTLNEAIARATNTHYGLQPGVFTAGLETALVVAERLRVGAVR